MTDQDEQTVTTTTADRLIGAAKERRNNMMWLSWLVGLPLFCFAGVAVISAIQQEASFSFFVAPVLGALWFFFVTQWLSARKSVAQLRASVAPS